MAAVAISLLAGTGAHAQCELQQIQASDGLGDFGSSAAMDGTVAIIGSSSYGLGGLAYILRHDGASWTEEATLVASDGAPGDGFGGLVAIHGDVAIAGAAGDDDLGDKSGSAYVFRFDGSEWLEETKLLAPDGTNKDYFGQSVAVGSNVLVVGAPGDDDMGLQSGSVYVFVFDGSSWNLDVKLTASDGTGSDEFGNAVAIRKNLMIVGARDVDGPYSSIGAAYIFRHDGSTWSEEAVLKASDPWDYDYFGSAVSIDDGFAVVGAPGGFYATTGRAFVFRYDETDWVEDALLAPPGAGSYAYFGTSVAVDGDNIFIGAHGADGSYPDGGAAYSYGRDESEWSLRRKLIPSDGESYDEFGISVALSGELALAGDPEHGPGTVYAFHAGLSGDDCNGNSIADECELAVGLADDCQPNGIPDDCDIADGTSQDINGNGIPDECECPADITGDGTIDVLDLLAVLSAWGPCPPICPADVNSDGVVDVLDLLEVLAAWGQCL